MSYKDVGLDGVQTDAMRCNVGGQPPAHGCAEGDDDPARSGDRCGDRHERLEGAFHAVVSQAARRCSPTNRWASSSGISLSKIQTLVKDGGLPAVNVGERSHRVRRTDLAAYVETLTPVPAQVAS